MNRRQHCKANDNSVHTHADRNILKIKKAFPSSKLVYFQSYTFFFYIHCTFKMLSVLNRFQLFFFSFEPFSLFVLFDWNC